MQEYVTDAIVLDSRPYRELDLRLSLFTERFGKIQARARSARKITSKLRPHLEPGTMSRVRLIETSGVQVVDALKFGRNETPLPVLGRLEELLQPFHPEKDLWEFLSRAPLAWREVLRLLGWDPARASCTRCRRAPGAFRPQDQEFFCESCASQIPADQLLYIERQ